MKIRFTKLILAFNMGSCPYLNRLRLTFVFAMAFPLALELALPKDAFAIRRSVPPNRTMVNQVFGGANTQPIRDPGQVNIAVDQRALRQDASRKKAQMYREESILEYDPRAFEDLSDQSNPGSHWSSFNEIPRQTRISER